MANKLSLSWYFFFLFFASFNVCTHHMQGESLHRHSIGLNYLLSWSTMSSAEESKAGEVRPSGNAPFVHESCVKLVVIATGSNHVVGVEQASVCCLLHTRLSCKRQLEGPEDADRSWQHSGQRRGLARLCLSAVNNKDSMVGFQPMAAVLLQIEVKKKKLFWW